MTKPFENTAILDDSVVRFYFVEPHKTRFETECAFTVFDVLEIIGEILLCREIGINEDGDYCPETRGFVRRNLCDIRKGTLFYSTKQNLISGIEHDWAVPRKSQGTA